MTYFTKFPQVIITRGNQPLIIRDFLSRVVVSEKTRNNLIYLENYLIQDGETPELLSNKLYGTPTYHWILLMVNEIIDPREQWPITNRKVIDRVYMNYDIELEVPNGSEYTAGDELVNSVTLQDKFIVTSVSGNFVNIRSLSGFIRLTTSSTLNNITTEVDGLPIVSVTLPENRVHHAYDTVLDCIVDFDEENPNIEIVTNIEHEMTVNDNKRNIKILRPDAVSTFVKEFENEIGA